MIRTGRSGQRLSSPRAPVAAIAPAAAADIRNVRRLDKARRVCIEASPAALNTSKTVSDILALRQVAAISIDGSYPPVLTVRFMKRFLPQVPAAILSVALLPALVCGAAAQEPCKFTETGTGTVASIRDGRTLLLADGRELRLAAIEVTDNSRSTLQTLVAGRDLRLLRLGPEQDRYGRLVAI